MEGFKYPKEFRPHLANLEKPKTRAQQLMSELGIDGSWLELIGSF